MSLTDFAKKIKLGYLNKVLDEEPKSAETLARQMELLIKEDTGIMVNISWRAVAGLIKHHTLKLDGHIKYKIRSRQGQDKLYYRTHCNKDLIPHKRFCRNCGNIYKGIKGSECNICGGKTSKLIDGRSFKEELEKEE